MSDLELYKIKVMLFCFLFVSIWHFLFATNEEGCVFEIYFTFVLILLHITIQITTQLPPVHCCHFNFELKSIIQNETDYDKCLWYCHTGSDIRCNSLTPYK